MIINNNMNNNINNNINNNMNNNINNQMKINKHELNISKVQAFIKFLLID